LTKLLTWLTSPDKRLYSATLLYYACLYFVNANIWLLLLTCGYIAVIYLITKQTLLTLWLALLVTLPLAKGKTLNFSLLDKAALTSRNAVFDVGYILSFYVSDFILSLLLIKLTQKWWQQRSQIKLLATKFKSKIPSWQKLGLCLTWLTFLIVALLPHSQSYLWPIIALSTLELIKLTLIFLIPSWLLILNQPTKIGQQNFIQATLQVVMASIWFQAAWSSLQFLTGGPLGKYIEAILPLGAQGQAIALGTMENWEILRVTGSFFDPSLLGTFLVTAISWLWYNQKQLQPKWWLWLTMLAALGTVILTSNRILMLIMLIWIIWELKHWLKSKQNLFASLKKNLTSLPTLVVGLILILGTISLSPYILTRMSSLNRVFDQYGSATYRLQLGWYGIRLGMSNFWGVGLNLSPYYLATGFNQETVSFDPSHPHNLWLQLFAETGWIGASLFLVGIYLIYRPIAKSSSQAKLDWQMSGWGKAGLMFLICAQFYPVFINQIEVASWLALMLGGHWASRQNWSKKLAK